MPEVPAGLVSHAANVVADVARIQQHAAIAAVALTAASELASARTIPALTGATLQFITPRGTNEAEAGQHLTEAAHSLGNAAAESATLAAQSAAAAWHTFSG